MSACASHNVLGVVNNRRDVLNHQHTRSQYLGGAGHPEVKAVLGVVSACVVVEVAVSLARGAADEQVDFANLPSRDALGLRGGSTEVSVKVAFDGADLDVRSGEVSPEDVDRCLLEVQGKRDLERKPMLVRSLRCPERQTSAACEQVNNDELVLTALELRAHTRAKGVLSDHAQPPHFERPLDRDAAYSSR